MIKTIRILLGGVAILMAAYFIGCKKTNEPVDIIDTKATINNSGAVAADGCGYTVLINGAVYHADNLSSDYAVDKLNVVLSAKITTDKYQCGSLPNNYLKVIHIVSITKQ